MSKKLQKSLQDYISKIKKSSPNSNSVSSSPRKWIMKGCKHPKTLSFAVNGDHGQKLNFSDADNNNKNNNKAAATLSDVDRFLLENFRSLYIKDDEEGVNEIRRNDDHQVKSPAAGVILFDSPRFVDPPPDLCGSNRFFVATGLSSSLIEEARNSGVSVTNTTTLSISEDMGSTSTSTSTDTDPESGGPVPVSMLNNTPNIPKECIAVLTYSPNPYHDFKRSMQQIVQARLQHHSSSIDWDFMEELLFCYLNLNDNKSYKFILSAFVDLIVDLRQTDNKIPVQSRSSKLVNVRDHKRSRRTTRK